MFADLLSTAALLDVATSIVLFSLGYLLGRLRAVKDSNNADKAHAFGFFEGYSAAIVLDDPRDYAAKLANDPEYEQKLREALETRFEFVEDGIRVYDDPPDVLIEGPND